MDQKIALRVNWFEFDDENEGTISKLVSILMGASR